MFQFTRNGLADNNLEDITSGAMALKYHVLEDIPTKTKRVDTRSKWAGEVTALSLAGYSYQDIQKMGQ